MAENGKNIVTGISCYLIAKEVLNIILGGNIIHLIITAVFVALLFLGASGNLKYANIIAAIGVALVALYYLPTNLRGLPSSWIYLLEGIVDFVCAGLLVFSADVKAYFGQAN